MKDGGTKDGVLCPMSTWSDVNRGCWYLSVVRMKEMMATPQSNTMTKNGSTKDDGTEGQWYEGWCSISMWSNEQGTLVFVCCLDGRDGIAFYWFWKADLVIVGAVLVLCIVLLCYVAAYCCVLLHCCWVLLLHA